MVLNQRLNALFGVGTSAVRETVGIDVTETELRVVCVANRGRAWQWLSRARSVFPQPLFGEETHRDGFDVDSNGQTHASERSKPLAANVTPPHPDTLASALAEHLPHPIDGFARAAAVVAPASTGVIRWPGEQTRDLFQESLRVDLGKTVRPRDTVESCGWPIGKTAKQMVYAISGGVAHTIAEGVARSGYQVPRVESRPHALARALSLDAGGDAGIILSWEATECVLIFTEREANGKGYRPSLCRQLHGVHLWSILEQKPDDNADAERRGCFNRERALARLVTSAGEEINRTLRIAQTMAGVPTDGPIVICGAGAGMGNWLQRVSDIIDRPLRPWVWGGASKPYEHPAAPADALFAVALAAACGGGS